MSYRRLRAMFVKELHHVTRDSRSLAMAIAMPMMMLLLYGYALSLDVDHIQTLVYDEDGTAASRDLTRQFQGSQYFEVVGFVHDYQAIQRAIDTSRGASVRIWRADRARCNFWSTAAIPTPPPSPWGTPREWSKVIRPPCAAT
jgi:hypothetical protein